MMNESNLKQTTQDKLAVEICNFINSRQSLQLASLDADGSPYASYAPFGIGENCLYVLLSEIALHAINLQVNPTASVLVVEDEDTADELFARIRVNYRVEAEMLEADSDVWKEGIELMANRLGERINGLSKLSDFRLFKLHPRGGRYVKGFGRAYHITGNTLAGAQINHLRDGHKKREIA